MFCHYCGREISEKAAFCPYCGKRAIRSDEPEKTVQGKPEKKTPKRKKWPWILLLLLLISLIAGAVLVPKIIDKLSGEKTPESKTYDENSIGELYFYQTEEEHIAADENGNEYADNEILLVASETASFEDIEKLAKPYHAEIVGWIEQTGDYQLSFPQTYSKEELEDIAASLEKDDRVLSACVDYVFPIADEAEEHCDSFVYGAEWEADLQDSDDCQGKSWGWEAINTFWAWDLLEVYSDQVNPVRVGLIDNGFDAEHEDLGFAETFYNVVAEHGTHVAGIMAAKADNQEGICGVYPYGDGNLYGVSYAGICSAPENGSLRTTSMGLKIAYSELILRNVKVINSSLGFNYKNRSISYTDPGWKDRVDFLESNAYLLADFLDRLLDKGYDFVLVNSAGNDSDRGKNILYDSRYNFWTTVISREDYPEVYDRIIVVGAVDSDLEICNFSNGGERVDIYAPGDAIFSTMPENQYDNMSGTSMATPHVSGVAAMVWSANRDLTGSKVKEIVCQYTNMDCTSCKLVDASIAVGAALNTVPGNQEKQPENGSILCWVVDADNEEIKIRNARISATNVATGETETTTTDTSGHFELILPEGAYSLTVQAEGYQDYAWPDGHADFTNPIVVKSNSVNYLDDWIRMERDGEQPTEDFLREVLYRELGDANIADFCPADYDRDGDLEAFAVIGEFDEYEWSCYGSLYFVTADGVEQVLDREGFYVYDESAHLLEFDECCFYLIEKYAATGGATYVFGVSDNDWYENEISLGGMGLSRISGTNELEITESSYDGAWDKSMEQNLGHTWKPYYLYWDHDCFREYGGIQISRGDFRKCDGAEAVLKQIEQNGYTISDIIYRGNGIININYYIEDESFINFQNCTLLLEGTRVTVQSMHDNGNNPVECSNCGGTYAEAFLPEIAVYPESFPLSDSPAKNTGGDMTEEEAVAIACDYWEIDPGTVDENSGYEMSVFTEEFPTETNHRYHMALRWLVEGHWSTLDEIYIDAVTGACTSCY